MEREQSYLHEDGTPLPFPGKGVLWELSASLKERTAITSKRLHAWFAYQLDDQKPPGTIVVLDGVRALACIMVVVYHSTGVVNGHWDILRIPFFDALNLFLAKGVTLFFLLSGFLLFLPYVQALLFEKRWPQARLFYMRRILRIVPGYFFSLFAIILLANPSYLGMDNWGTLLSFLTFFMAHHQTATVNSVYWTLAVEFQYYMLLPLIALGIYGLTRLICPKRRLWVIVGALLVLVVWGMVTRFWGYTVFARSDAQAYLAAHPIINVVTFLVYGSTAHDSGKYFEDFGVGMLLAVCYSVVMNASQGERYRHVLWRLSPWFWWIGVALLVFAAGRNDNKIFMDYPDWAIELVFALGFGCCMLAVLFNGSGVLKRLFAWTPLRWVGLISFSLYLWHFPIIGSLKSSLAVDLFARLSVPLALTVFALVEGVLVLVVSFTLYVMVEKPGMRLSGRLRNKMLARHEQKGSARARSQKTESGAKKTGSLSTVALAENTRR